MHRMINLQDENVETNLIPSTHRNQKHVYYKFFDTKETIYTDQTGKIPVKSSRGHRYIMVMVEIDANYIDAEPTKKRTEDEMTRAHQAFLKWITETGVCITKTYILDNEASDELKIPIKKSKLQLVPSDTHRKNIAESSIQTFKNNIVAILLGVDPKFTMILWCILLPQTVLTLNLVRQSHEAPK